MVTLAETAGTKLLSEALAAIVDFGKERLKKGVLKWKNDQAAKQLYRRISAVEKVKTFWQRDKELLLRSFYYPSKVAFPKSPAMQVRSLMQFPREHNYVIEGTVGQGKSIFLRYLCVQELSRSGSGRIPVFIECRTILEGTLQQAIHRALETLGFQIDDALFSIYAHSGKLVLLLDAFDELPDALMPKVAAQLEQLAERYPELQTIVTSRPSGEMQNSRHFRVVRLAPLEPADHKPFLAQIGLQPTEIRQLQTAIKSSGANVGELLTTPLMLTLLVVVYRAEKVVPAEIPEFYERLFQTLFSKHDSTKPGYIRGNRSGLGERRLQQLFEAFCFVTLQQGRGRSLKAAEFDAFFSRALKLVDFKCEVEGFKQDITRIACLMQDEQHELHFIHKSVVEFYAASFIRNRETDAAQRFYQGVLNGRWEPWRQVLRFLIQIDPYRCFRHYRIPSIDRTFALLKIHPVTAGATDVDTVLSSSGIKAVQVLARFDPDSGSIYEDAWIDDVRAASHAEATVEVSEIAAIVATLLWNSTFENLLLLASPKDIERESPRANPKVTGFAWSTLFTPKQWKQFVASIESCLAQMRKTRRECIDFVAREDERTDLIAI